jgi:hypothetical protein
MENTNNKFAFFIFLKKSSRFLHLYYYQWRRRSRHLLVFQVAYVAFYWPRRETT